MNRYIMTDGVKSIDLPQFPNEAWTFYSGDNSEGKEDFYGRVSSVFRAFNITADVTAAIPFALVDKSGKDYDISTEWENKVGFMKCPKELIRLWRLSLSATNSAYGFMENIRGEGKNLRYILPSSITPILDREHGNGLLGFKRTVGTRSDDYSLGKKNPIFWMWRRDHTTELLPSKATQFQALCAAAGILYYSDNHIQAFFKRGGIKPTMLVLKGMAPPGAIEKIERSWTKIISGWYKELGKVFQGVDAAGGLEALPIGEGVDNLKDETLTKSKVEDIAMAMGIPLSIMLANSANYATAQVEYKSWYENALAPWCSFMAEEMTDKLFKPLNLRFEFRPEMTDPGQEDEVARASAYSTYVNAGIKPSIAAQVIGMELPQGIEFEALDQMQEERQQQAVELMQEKQSSSDDEEKPDAVQKEKVTKFVPNLDQLKEMDIWRKFAFRHFKKGEPLTFAFEVKTLPDDIAEGIRCGLELADSEDAIKQAFELKFSATQPREPAGSPEGGQWIDDDDPSRPNTLDKLLFPKVRAKQYAEETEFITITEGTPKQIKYAKDLRDVFIGNIKDNDNDANARWASIRLEKGERLSDLETRDLANDILNRKLIRIVNTNDSKKIIDVFTSDKWAILKDKYRNLYADIISHNGVGFVYDNKNGWVRLSSPKTIADKEIFDELVPEIKSDLAILKLADAINKACKNVAVPD